MTRKHGVQDPGREAIDSVALAQQLRTTVGQFVRAVRNHTGTATTAQSEVLAHLERDGPASVARLSAVRGVTHQSMRLVVARLVDQGMLVLHPDPLDRRSQLVSLTARGRSEVRANQAARSACLAALIDTRLSEAERIQLAAAITLMARLSVDA